MSRIYDLNETSQSITVFIGDDDGQPVTGLVAATFPPVEYNREGPNDDVSITLADLALITTPWASGGVKERGVGYYRLDLPDAIFATRGRYTVRGEATGKHLLPVPLNVSPQLAGTTVASVTNLAYLTSALAQSYRSAGAEGTLQQLLYEILQNITEFAISGTTKTVKQLDGSTTAKTYTLNSATNPTSITETT